MIEKRKQIINFHILIVTIATISSIWNIEVTAQTEPPPDGDWIISDITVKSNVSIVLNGNLIVENGGILTLDNVELIINCTTDGQLRIEIQKEGTLVIRRTNITAYNPLYPYRFEVYGRMDMDWCNIDHLWGANFSVADLRIGGIQIFSDHVKITNTTILHSNGDGIMCVSSSPLIAYNTIMDTEDDGISCNSSSPTIKENIIENSYCGLYIYNDSAPIISNNILNSVRSIRLSTGISISHSNNVILKNNVVNDFFYGIRFSHSSPHTIYNNSFFDCGVSCHYSSPLINNIIINGSFNSVYCDDFSNLTIINSTIIDSGQYDIFLQDFNNGNSHVTLINTTFDRNKVRVTPTSSLTAQWYVHVKILDMNGSAVPNIDIRILANESESTDINYITDNKGWVKWILRTEFIENSTNRTHYTPHRIIAEKEDIWRNSTIEEIRQNTLVVLVLQRDSDGDWIPDERDALPDDPTEWLDNDEDGVGDNADEDDDNDGYSDIVENREGCDPFLDTSFPVDFDHDFDPDSTDPDDDNDGVLDADDVFPYDPKEWSDKDGDGIGDNEDPDDNDNGIPDIAEIPLVVSIILIPIITFFLTVRHISTRKEKEKKE